MLYPLDPHPKVNKYHTICCGGNCIIYCLVVVKGNDHPIPMGRPDFEKIPNMNMVGLIFQLNILAWSTGKAVIMVSGFCVIKVLL